MGFGRGRVAYHTEHGIELYGIDAREWGGGRWKYGVCVAWHKKLDHQQLHTGTFAKALWWNTISFGMTDPEK